MGGGKGGGGNVEVDPEVQDASEQLINIGRDQFELGLPLLEQGSNQGLDILRGGQGALRPSILQALETGRSNASQAFTDVREGATLEGITGSALQERLAGTRAQNESDVSQIPSSFTLPTLQAIAQAGFGLPEEGIRSIASGTQGGASAAFAGPTSGGLIGGLSGAAGGALTGAQLGSAFPGYGTAIGAVVGAAAGGAKGSK